MKHIRTLIFTLLLLNLYYPLVGMWDCFPFLKKQSPSSKSFTQQIDCRLSPAVRGLNGDTKLRGRTDRKLYALQKKLLKAQGVEKK